MYSDFQKHLQGILSEIKEAGLYKNERVIITPQSSAIQVEGGKDVINFCANNYLGLADNLELIQAAKDRMDARGYGMASVRFICGTQDTHKQLEQAISDFFGTEDTILYAACFDANGGLFEPLLTEQDAIISDALNHASIIDGVRLCKAVRYRYANGDMADVEILEGVDEAALLRYGKCFSSLTPSQKKNLSNGPGKLCKALGIDRHLNGTACHTGKIIICDAPQVESSLIKTSPRIGVGYAGDDALLPYRFYVEHQ